MLWRTTLHVLRSWRESISPPQTLQKCPALPHLCTFCSDVGQMRETLGIHRELPGTSPIVQALALEPGYILHMLEGLAAVAQQPQQQSPAPGTARKRGRGKAAVNEDAAPLPSAPQLVNHPDN